ncbi:NADH dehydrogenase 1 beta subcomplex subunit 3 [Yarrowia lipolytica]|uniref:YALI0D10274p n=2 Tax=Yarrowia lipolytica TaxID=4952 RepID=B5FVE5_YARLI|nr:YALI0D10274p [Yarrowia lipolytica CLIB122]6GCS_c Chain c, NB2M SUBUNIT [Yarrowia lipolytica]6RFQ_c Chain c, Subunit NB2M of NADH:Ubiquinone Oxidoreductase (Complex I) [Yarrowia lipolytica]6RFR_c Chain c, Subunit NB2M of NADH:Ubiquinone Oxidoreductase (Complex I) [Yarrowia lipolytica]6RFS_c Chain c, Subunit NB2M of NADH:Ubiquinone Oxidoreductase (Complex I) [Yarrowia lipolytica]6Y79_c Chain c, Subunit NB2M of NADH:Ubiquinone Oxidoreductase (Complex I) [Yarrowia lipolytica]6YJ4_k Chain k, Su|eukprot:XP_002143052.1 YALI0D10274p [Yarrowia lipolytica CLIB122]
MAPQLKDPWARREAWRYQTNFTRANRFKGAAPGFGIAVVAFGAYLAAEKFLFEKKDDHHH